jgi:hypothetical protein
MARNLAFLSSASPEAVRLGTGAIRLLLGAGFLTAPTTAVRVLGVDLPTATRMRFLARMTAARDLGLGAGTLAAGPGAGAASWLAASAAADAVDAVAIAVAMRQGVTRGPAAGVTVAGAAVSAAAGVWAARRVAAGQH